MALENAAAQNEILSNNINNHQSQLLNEKLKRLIDLANLHDGDREQRDDVITSLPEGASSDTQSYGQQAPSNNSSLPNALLDRPWSNDALPEQTPPSLTTDESPLYVGGSASSSGAPESFDRQTPLPLAPKADASPEPGSPRPTTGGSNPSPTSDHDNRVDTTTPAKPPEPQPSTTTNGSNPPGRTPKPDPDRATISVSGAPGDLTVDETDLTTDATANFGAYFSATYGVNGKGIGGMSFKIGVVQPGTDSGLVDEGSGQHLLLFQNPDGSISGRTASGLEGFHITTDQVGNIELDQLRSIVHPDPTNTDESITLNNPNLITITGTAVSAGGDSASATIGIGQAFHFKDDAPSLQLTANGNPPVLGVDETFIGQTGGSSTQTFASVFSGNHQFGADGSGTFQSVYGLHLSKDGVFSGLIDSETGERILLHVNTQNGNITGILENTGREALQISTTQTGDITFTTERSVIHPDPTNTNEEIHLSPGLLALRRTDTITDKDGDSATSSAQIDLGSSLTIHDDAPSITQPATTGTIPDFVVTEQGGINGAASHNFSSNFTTGNSNAVDQNASLTTAFSFSLNPNGVDSGLQDHNGNHIFLFQSGDNVVGLVGNSNSPNPNGSNALQITLDPTNGQATFSSSQDLQHSDPSKSGTADQLSFKPNVLSITRTDTITDADGDHASASNSLDISGAFLINDTAPSITPPATTGTIPDFVVTEQGGINGAASHNFSSNFSTGNSNAVDQNASLTTAFSFSLNHNGVDSGLQDHNGNHIFLFQSGNNVVGLVGNSNSPNPNGSNALQITLDPTNGQATFSSSQDLQHSDPSKSGTADQLSFKPNVLSITRTDTITDADGDHASASNSLDISGAFLINDTAPSITPPATTGTIPDFVVTEQGGINGAASHNFSSNFSTGNSNAVDQNASLTTAFSFSLNHNGVDSGLQDHNGNHIFLFQSGNNVVGLVGNSNSPNPNGSNALQITLDPTNGQATFSSSQDLQHSDPSKSGTGDQLSFKPNVLSITRTDTITDADGDHASASNSLDISGAFLINDTAPSITPPATTGTIPDFVVTEQGGINGAASHNFSSNFSTGNSNAVDQNASLTTAFSFSLNPNGVDSGLQDHNGNHIFLFQSGNNVVGLVGNSNSPNPNGSNALQITLDPTNGQATFSSSQDLQHSDPSKSGTGDQLSFKPNVLSITRTDTITDADGDHASASNSLDISGAFLINDTAPSITPPATTGTIPDFVVTEQGGINGAASHNFSSNFSTGNSNAVDQNASLTTAFSFSLNHNGVDSGLQDHNGNHIFLFQSGNNVVGLVGNSNSPNPNGSNALQITLDPTNGQATFSSSQDLQHSDPSKSGTGDQLSFKPNVLSITRTDTITDADGDHASASNSLDISGAFLINDTAPSVDPSKVGTLSPLVTDDDTLNVDATTSLSSLFSSAFTPGADGTQSIAYSLALSAQDANSGLHALNPSGGPNQGPEILLHRDSNGVIHGYPSGGKSDGTEDLFTITIDGKNNLVLDQIKPIWQDNTSSNNEQTILKAIPNTLKITATITDQDGDSASTSIDASSGIFAFQDSGPSISMGTGQQTTSTPSPNPQTPVNPGTITTQTTDIYDPHQNLGLILDYSGSMFDNGLKGEHAGWSRNAQHNLSRINQQLKATAETIEEALKNAGYEVQYSSGNQTNLDQWTVKTQQGHVPGNVHLGLAIFGSNVDTNDLIMRDITFNQNTKQVSYSALSQINTALHQASQGNTNHEAAWHAANSIVSDWLAINKSDPDSVTSGGVKHAINTDTNLLIMTDGETTRGQEIISKNSFIIADDHSTPNRGNGISYFNIKDQGNEAQALFRRVAGHINGWHNLSSSNDRNKAGIEIQLTDSAGIHRSIKVTAQEVYEAITSTHELGINTHGSEHRYSDSMPITYTDNNGIQHTVGWLGFPQMKDSSSQTVNPLVFTPNEAKGYTANSVLTSGDIIHDPQPAHATQLSQSQFSSNGASVASMLTDSLSKLDSMAGHQNSNVIGVGLVDSNNDALNSQLEGLFSGSLPQGSTYTKVTTDSTGPSVAQQIHKVVQQQFTDVNYKVEFTFNPGADDDASSGNVSPSGIVEFSLEKVGRLTTGGIHHFLETFGGISSGPNVKELPNGEYEITVQNLGIFTINTQSTLITTGSHVGTIEFKAFPGSKLTSDLQLEIGIKDADGDIKTVDFTIPKFDTTGSSSQTQHDEPDQNGFTADISVIANDALASAQADSDTEATLAALISLGLKTDHDDIDLSQSTQDDGSQLITRTIHTDQGDILETITDPQNGDAPSLQLDVSGLDADTQKDLQATIQAQTSSSDSESKPGQLDSVLSDATQSPPAIDGQSLADAISDLQQLDADAIAALNGQVTSTNSANESSLSGDAAQTTRPQDPSDVPVTSMEDAFTSPQQTDDDVMAPPDLSDTSQTAAPLPDNSTQDQDLSLLNS